MKPNKFLSILTICSFLSSSALHTYPIKVYADSTNNTQSSVSDTETNVNTSENYKYNLNIDNADNKLNTVTEKLENNNVLVLTLNSDKNYHISDIIINNVSLDKKDIYNADDKKTLKITLTKDKETDIKVVFSENKDCTISFLNYDGEEVKSIIVSYNEPIDYLAVDTSTSSPFYIVVDPFTQIRFSSWDCELINARDDMKIQALYQKANMLVKSLPEKTKYSFKSEDIDLTGLSVILTVDTQLPGFDKDGKRLIDTEQIDVAEICYPNFKTAKEAFNKSNESEIFIYAPKNDISLASYKITLDTPFILGDVDENGVVNASDASLTLAHYALLSTSNSSSMLTQSQINKADVDKNKAVNASDASYILCHYALESTGKNPEWDKIIQTKK